MASIVEKAGRTKLWMKVREGGRWQLRPTPYTREQRHDALRYAKRTQQGIDKREANGQSAKLTVRNYFKNWLEARKAADIDWKHDDARMRIHVLPVIGDKLVPDVKPQHIIEVAQRIRRKVAQRTVYNIYSAMCAFFRDAQLEGIIEQTPCILDERQLGPKVDKDPEWRATAVYERDEVVSLISDQRITWDQRIHYGIAFLEGLRHGEVSSLKWRHWDATATPLGRMLVATSYSTEKRKTKGTKTETVRHLPVHPTLAIMLGEWRATGWAQMMGREPTKDDLILPLPPEHQKRRRKERNSSNRDSDYSYKRWQADLATLELRPRRAHDARATFVTLCLDDGADPGVVERLTHPPKSRSSFNLYNPTLKRRGRLRHIRRAGSADFDRLPVDERRKS
jgi:integrase